MRPVAAVLLASTALAPLPGRAQPAAGPVVPLGGTPRTLLQWARDVADAEDAGLRCDHVFGSVGSGTDNTAALQALIDRAQTVAAQGNGRTVVVPGCRGFGYRTGPLTITGQIDFEGASNFGTTLVLKAGSDAPLLTIRPRAAIDFVGVGFPNGQVVLRDLRITSEDGRGGNGRHPGAAGIALARAASDPLPAWVQASQVLVTNMPGDGIAGASFDGLASWFRTYMVQNSDWGSNTNSNTDWRWIDCDWGINQLGGILSSGDGQMLYVNPNSYASPAGGAYFYDSDAKISDGSFDDNGTYGLRVGIDDGHKVDVAVHGLTTIANNSNRAKGSYPDVQVDAAPPGAFSMIGTRLASVVSPATPTVSYNVRLAPGAYASCTSCVFPYVMRGSAPQMVPITSITNAPGQFISWGNEFGVLTARGPTRVVAGTRYQGFAVGNGASDIFKAIGTGSGNDTGLIAVLSGGAANVQLSALPGGGLSHVNDDLFMGGGSSQASPTSWAIRGPDGAAGGDVTLAVSPPGGRPPLAYSISGTTGAMVIPKLASPPSVAPGAGHAALFLLPGRRPGTCRLMLEAGTSTVATAILDDVGSGC